MLAADYSRAVAHPARDLRELLVKAAELSRALRLVVPPGDDLPPLCFRHQRELRQATRGVAGRVFEQCAEVAERARDRRRVEEVCVEVTLESQPVAMVHHVQAQVELAVADGRRDPLDLQPEHRRDRERFEVKGGREEWEAARVARAAQLFDQAE